MHSEDQAAVVGVSLVVAVESHFERKKCEFRVYGILKFLAPNFCGLLGIRENRENYMPRKFGCIRL